MDTGSSSFSESRESDMQKAIPASKATTIYELCVEKAGANELIVYSYRIVIYIEKIQILRRQEDKTRKKNIKEKESI